MNIPLLALLSLSNDCNTLKSFTSFSFVMLFLATSAISEGRILPSLFIFERLKSFAIINLPIVKVIVLSVLLYLNVPLSSVFPVAPEFVSYSTPLMALSISALVWYRLDYLCL